jgi:hypothetical protein
MPITNYPHLLPPVEKEHMMHSLATWLLDSGGLFVPDGSAFVLRMAA